MNPFSNPKQEFNYPTYRTLITYRSCQGSHGAAQAVFTFVKLKVSRESQSPHISICFQGHLIESKIFQESSAHHPLLSGHLTPQLKSTKSLPNTSLGSSSEIKLFSFPASYHPSLQRCPLNNFILLKVMKWQQKVSWQRLTNSPATNERRMILFLFSSGAVTRWDILPVLWAVHTCGRWSLINTYFLFTQWTYLTCWLLHSWFFMTYDWEFQQPRWSRIGLQSQPWCYFSFPLSEPS